MEGMEWYGIVIPFTLDPVTNHGFALLTKYEMFETGTRHSTIFFSIYNWRIVGRHNVRHMDLLTFAVASLKLELLQLGQKITSLSETAV